MALSETTRKRVELLLEAFCEERVPARVRDKVRLTFDTRGNRVTLYEERTVYDRALKNASSPGQLSNPVTIAWMKTPIAQFRLDPKSMKWQLYCKHRDERWHVYINTLPTHSFMELLSEVDQDPTCIFWG